jgi:hypothetical protein
VTHHAEGSAAVPAVPAVPALPAPMVTSFRTRDEEIQMARGDAPIVTIRAQLAAAWDAVRIEVSSAESVEAVKAQALLAFDATRRMPSEYVVTLRGALILDESRTLADVGVVNGSTLLISHRHRRPVR